MDPNMDAFARAFAGMGAGGLGGGMPSMPSGADAELYAATGMTLGGAPLDAYEKD